MGLEAKLQRRANELLQRIPGYQGYRAKEDRRDADRRVRDHLVQAYDTQADRIERVARDLATQRRIQDVGPVDAFAQVLRHFIDRVRVATYGYGGLFSDRDVDEAALDQIRQFDESLVAGVDELKEGPIDQLEQAAAGSGDLRQPAAAGEAVVRSLLARFDLRDQVIETAEPAPPESVMKALQPAAPQTSPGASQLKQGDALSISGDNFIVDAQVEVEAGPNAFRLLRLKGAPNEQWLYVPHASAEPFALLAASADPYTPGAETKIGQTAYQETLSGSGKGELTGDGGSSGRRTVRYALLTGRTDESARAIVLDWGNERQVLAGKELGREEIEVYGPPAAPR